jgi:L-2-hydroxyglutarate oxidase LhgO
VAEGEGSQDFEILDANDHGLDNLIHLQGIDSPGLTSSLAIAAEAISKLGIH